jgi:hypothetical protein
MNGKKKSLKMLPIVSATLLFLVLHRRLQEFAAAADVMKKRDDDGKILKLDKLRKVFFWVEI